MNKWYASFAIGLMACMSLASCSKEFRQYSQWSRKGTTSEKDSAAFYFYERGDYEKASLLFEELQSIYKGEDRARTVLYHYAESKFNYGLYVVAAYYYEQYSRLYPNDELASECAFKVAYCYYVESAPHYLDQEYTLKAIDQFQLYVNSFPETEQAIEAEKLMAELRERLAQKSFEQARTYLRVGNFRAAVTAFDVMIRQFPDSRYREEAQFLQFESAAELAEVSTQAKKRNRYLDALEYYENFVDRYPNSAYIKQAEGIYVRTKKNYGKMLAGQNS
ncbi:outer membrane protein assembly factor BamD [Pontibacter sp. G13]|uniref:outer membrane protein assembly factor BamD n=1 Tax=Pontibacter sp. G13 TaxID=3074898 RepID=UPI00288B0B84|nr:outer membrane protein assembly factor BamD [Pontibacter sp. G13]WNJ20827.1 outer membrane protein assembly factor BamD [Pontibacter sp. G13]